MLNICLSVFSHSLLQTSVGLFRQSMSCRIRKEVISYIRLVMKSVADATLNLRVHGVRACVCVCVCERERERERAREREPYEQNLEQQQLLSKKQPRSN